ncbi:MAG: GGDEF domain-containing protein, partial [Deltaproteobacteria bacterium]|nr:GGDEF domain-containing protein [Deltaproteobacteria bacterium]
EGDRILKAVAKVLKDNLRETDLIARWGGEEFLAVCPGNGVEGARQLAEKLRLALLECPEKVTCSFGVAELAEGSFQDLIKKADQALYYAKENGRNRVEVASTLNPTPVTRVSTPAPGRPSR